MRARPVCKALGILCLLGGESLAHGQADDYRKATEGSDVVKNKIYPKQKRIELSLPNAGLILNQSYVNTILISGGVNYFSSEEWGFGVDFSLGNNSDKDERGCIENFYNDPNEDIPEVCGPPENIPARAPSGGEPNYGPAYVPIREIQYLATVNAIWNPVYGKQLVLLSATSYFDLFIEVGAGIAVSKFYPEQETLRNGNRSRGEFEQGGKQPTPPIGASPNEPDSYGILGRPDVQDETNVLINLGIGQKFHFGKRFHLKMYLRNMTLVGTQPSGFENLFALFGGVGFRF